MSNLTDDEYTVLMIAAEGQSMMAIARWEKPTESLVAKGLLRQHDKFNNVITDAGRKVLAAREKETTQAIASTATAVTLGRQQAQMSAEQAAQHLVLAAKASVVTGDSLDTAARQWANVALRRALELLAQ